MGVIEENGNLDCSVEIHIDYAVSHYETDIRIDNRKVLCYIVVDDVPKWWEDYDGYLPASVPEQQPTTKIIIVNASMDNCIWVDIQNAGNFICRILDCCGKEIRKEVVCLDRPAALRNIPVNGMAELSSC